MSDESSNSSMEDEEQPMSLVESQSSTSKSEDTQEHGTTESAQQASTSKGPSKAKTSSSSKSFVCKLCNSKPFATKQSLQRHTKSIHEKKRSTGASAAVKPKSGIMSTSKQSETDETKPGHKRRHTTNEDGEPASTSRKKSKETVQKQTQPPELSEDEDEKFSLMDDDPLEFPSANNRDVPDIIRENWADIRTNRKDGRPAQDVYNFRLYALSRKCQHHELKWSQQRGQLMAIFEKLECRCKMNISFGFVLRHRDTDTLRYFHPSNNNARLFETPFIIASRDDITRFIDSVDEKEPLEFAAHQRPDTKWCVHEITNMAVYVNKMPDLPIGCCDLDELPPFIKNNKGLHSLVKSRQTGKVFKDNLCFFRCLALHNGSKIKNCEKETKRLFGEYKMKRNIRGDDFQGIRLDELRDLEKKYKTNIMVYSIETEGDEVSDDEDEESDDEEDEASSEEEDDDDEKEVLDSADPNTEPRRSQRKVAGQNTEPRRSQRKAAGPYTEPRRSRPEATPGAKRQEQRKTFAKLVYRSRKTMKKTMYLNLFGRHFSYIKDFNLYSNTFWCTNTWCNRVFRRSNGRNKHMEKCSKEIKHIFPGSVYRPAPSIFDKLEDEGISVPEEHRCFPHFATLSFKSFQSTPEKTGKTTKTQVEYVHIPLSVSVLSNVPGFEACKCIISKGDPQKLVDEVIENLKTISEASYKNLRGKKPIKEVFVKLEKQLGSVCTQDSSGSKGKLEEHLTRLKQNFEGYLKELPVLGFESSKFGVNLVKQYLYTSLKKSDPHHYVIKRNNTYLAIKTNLFKFLDISNYLVQGCIFADFLKSYECEGVKGFFPDEWMDSLEKLNHETLPPKKEFKSKLSGTCLSAEDYKTCREVWDENNMQTMRDYLKWYSNRDLVPFMKAVEKMSQFYKDKNIGMFKDGISAPGLSLRYLFQSMTGDDFFTLIEKQHQDFYRTLKDNIVGGPAIVFHRYHEKGVTEIRGDKNKMCQKVIGYDANALYLKCLMQEMPVGHFIRRKAENNFKPQVSHSHMSMAIEWLEWESLKQKVEIQHKGNAREKRIGPTRVPVDGYCKKTNTVYEFYGCYWHGHSCRLNKKTFNKNKKKTMKELREETEEKAKKIRAMDHQLVEKWECQWEEEKKSNEELREFLESRRLPFQGKLSMKIQDIIEAIRSGELFGFVECDIRVPDSEKEKFSEMTPIFKNMDIAFDKSVIGDHMYEYAECSQLLTKPRRTLIGSMFGEKILLITPLIKWYLQNGLEVTKIYQVIQYKASKCFEKFGEEVSDARREGDASGSTARADTMKLIGNSAYGKTVTNKENFKDVKVCMTDADASRLFNNQRFRTTTDIGQGVHEVEVGKRSVKVDLPLQIGFFVYQYAKLKMLQFYYEFLDKFIDRSDFQLCQMDTDSAYIAIAGHDLESVIKPELKEEYEREKHKWFPRCDTPENKRYDKRTPGLFKVEFEGDGIVALCSKTYICFGHKKDKVSSKGLNKKQNDLSKEKFLDVLKTKRTGVGLNRGYRRLGKDLVNYSQLKGALSYLYIKRKVAGDGVTTTYLDI